MIDEFALEPSTNVILERCAISKYKLLKLLIALRTVMTQDIAEPFSGIVEVDGTSLGDQWKNKPLKIKRIGKKSQRGRGTTKQPAFGILCRNGLVGAEVFSGVEADDLQPLMEKQVRKGSMICSDTGRAYTGIATKGYVHRLVNHSEQEYSDRQGGHINGLEGGIRKEKLPLFVGEYVWQ